MALALGLWLGAAWGVTQNITVTRQQVLMDVQKDSVRVRVEFYIRNDALEAQKTQFFFMFPLTDGMGFPGTISVTSRQLTQTEFTTSPNKDGIFIPLDLGPRQKDKFIVEYTQPIAGSKVIFPLTGYLNQTKPIEQALYVINLPGEYTDINLSIRFTNLTWGKGRISYNIEKQDFMPDRDLAVTWTK